MGVNNKDKKYFKMMIGKKETFLTLIKHLGEVHLIDYIINTMNKDTFEWICNATTRQKAVERLDSSNPTINRYLKNLTSYGILSNPHRGIYIVNRQYIDYVKYGE